MSDLINRQDAIDVLEILADKMSDEGKTVMAQAVAVMKDLRSSEPERTAKVMIDNVSHVIRCEKCERVVSIIDGYCPGCGAKLDWSGVKNE